MEHNTIKLTEKSEGCWSWAILDTNLKLVLEGPSCHDQQTAYADAKRVLVALLCVRVELEHLNGPTITHCGRLDSFNL